MRTTVMDTVHAITIASIKAGVINPVTGTVSGYYFKLHQTIATAINDVKSGMYYRTKGRYYSAKGSY